MILFFPLRALRSEWNKASKTFVPWLAISAPFIYALLIYLTLYNAGDRLVKPGTDVWPIMISQSFQGLYVLFLPLAISILVALLYQTDHQANMWKHLYALPLPRWSIFVAKSLFGFLLIGFCLILFSGLMVFASYLLHAKNPSWGLDNFFSMLTNSFLPIAIKGWIASFSIWSIQNWISYRFRNFAIPLSFGLAATVVGAIVIQGWKNVFFFPYSFPVLSLAEITGGVSYHIVFKSLMIGGVVFLLSVIDAQKYFKSKAD